MAILNSLSPNLTLYDLQKPRYLYAQSQPRPKKGVAILGFFAAPKKLIPGLNLFIIIYMSYSNSQNNCTSKCTQDFGWLLEYQKNIKKNLKKIWKKNWKKNLKKKFEKKLTKYQKISRNNPNNITNLKNIKNNQKQ